MNSLRVLTMSVFFLSLSWVSINFLKNYNSPENIEKRCLFKFEKEFSNSSGISNEEWDLVLDLADNNYLKCMGILEY